MSHRPLDPAAESRRGRYQLLSSLVAPRPIGWISTWGPSGVPNVAPFSYFTALAAAPMLVGVSVGSRAGEPKDTLVNTRTHGAFCVNIVDVAHLEAMNATAAEVPPEVDEFELAGVPLASAAKVHAPYVADCPAVLECVVSQEVRLSEGGNTLVIGEVVNVLLRSDLEFAPGTRAVPTAQLHPVGRLWGSAYVLGGEVRDLPRPR